jgi:hypothetical protein
MDPTRAQMDAALLEERTRRLLELRSQSLKFLSALPPERSEKARASGRTIEFTTYVDRAYDGRLLVRVRSDEPWFLGLFTRGRTEGFWISENGHIAEATDDDILDFCG